jgi:hypothetical protein
VTASKIICAALGICLLAGCVADKAVIPFSDEPSRAVVMPAAAAVPQPKELSPADQRKISVVVYGWLLQRHFWDDGGYTAIFISGDAAGVKNLRKLFPNHLPPLKPAADATLRPGRTPLDAGKPAMVLSVNVGEPNADDSVDAIGKWFAGDAVTGFYTFVLRPAGGAWTIESVK